MNIYTIKDSILRQRSLPVKEEDISSLLLSMQEVVAEQGVGISAVQLGDLLRIFVLYVSKNTDPIIVINPELLKIGSNVVEVYEGCLSVPTVLTSVLRPNSATFRYTTDEGEQITTTFSDLEAAVALHEYDHLNGILFVDRAFNRENRRRFKQQFKVNVQYKESLEYELF